MSYKLLLICKLLSHEDCTVFWKSEEADVLDIGQVWLLVCPRPAKPLFNTSVIGDQDDHLQNSVAWGVEWLMRKVWRSRKPPFEIFPFVFLAGLDINSSPSVQMPLSSYLTGQIPTQMTRPPTWTHTLLPRGQEGRRKSWVSVILPSYSFDRSSCSAEEPLFYILSIYAIMWSFEHLCQYTQFLFFFWPCSWSCCDSWVSDTRELHMSECSHWLHPLEVHFDIHCFSGSLFSSAYLLWSIFAIQKTLIIQLNWINYWLINVL